MQRVYLNNNWKYRQQESPKSHAELVSASLIQGAKTLKQVQSDENWEEAKVPGNIHLDLLANKKIPDPYYRLNEQQQQWIGEVDWEYVTVFNFDEPLKQKNIEIVFEGLDTYADVYLNNNLILEADNMYCGWRANVKSYLKNGENELRVYFNSVIKKTLPLFNENDFEYPANNSQPEPKLSVYSRKPGYHFGWDWGPRLLTCGIWRQVYLEIWEDVRLDNVRFVQKSLSDDLAKLQLEIDVIASLETTVELNLSNPQNSFSSFNKIFKIEQGLNKLIIDFEIMNPRRWWCNGLGEAYLYELNIELKYEGNIIDSWKEKVGLRTLELIHEEDEFGKSFYFKLNGVPVFIKGSNILPVDYFIPHVKEEEYRKLLEQAVNTNMNMLRLWGGAIYEEKIFYDLCDEMGIMIWQDFMFACAMYPADEIMSKRIVEEAKYNVKRLRNHPCLALWCGNNEIDEGWQTWGWQKRYNYNEETSDLIWKYYCKIFHEILPETIKQLDSERPYWSSSPKYGFVDPKSKIDGDMHYWGVWFLNHPREKFKEYLPRFMSEYGLQSIPGEKTFREFSLPEDWDLKSDVMLAHQRQYPNPRKGQLLGGYDMMLKYMDSEYHVPEDFELLSYVSQILQADYLRYAIETHRRNKPYCMGTMYWQLNDVWPVTSWSTIDYYGRWKAAQYAVKKAYQSVLLSVNDEEDNISVFIINDLHETKSGFIKIQLIDFNGEVRFNYESEVLISSNDSKKYFSIDKKTLLQKINSNKIVLRTQLFEHDKLISENIFYFNYLKYLDLEDPQINYSIKKVDREYQIILHSKKLAKNVKLNIQDSEGFLSDNYFDLIPEDKKIILFKTNNEWNEKMSLLHYYLVSESVKEINHS